MSRSRAEWWEKANALAAGMGGAPSMATVSVLLAVAEGETRCGDAWPGEHNWGATTRRSLHAEERAVLKAASILPTVGPGHLDVEAKARAALAAAVAAGAIADPGPGCALHCDSTPTGGPYFIFFAAFPSDEEGAAYFAGFFKTAAEKAAITAGDPNALAAAMFHAGYYTGFHANDPAANIADYASNLNRLLPVIDAALVGWSPGASAPVVTEPSDGPDLGTVEGLQEALNTLGAAPALVVDGKLGPKTKAAVEAWQARHALAVDGIAGARTLGSIRAGLAALEGPAPAA